MTQNAATSRNRYFWLKPNLCVGDIILATFTNMYTRPVFVQGIITMEPKDKRASSQYFRTH
ncbi:protein of unknown function [Candidatus Promineifilum breve]|uniref:Uncharacterized protein n=1 Tax=Candidatus Promineifilum breve TaxID=1806508 RepID=A0A160T0B2_9CHLR|nr:protein of unknown function [Candidatus Promineifilum breve]